ncbi:hypothetical protein D4764_08G0001270 [Takifugu flavidus]|uniref:Uncharacterized protein n=1 Tax=Takifugu flavidus TaxID=433684 RepID=A0A5C6MRQ7_9TELE|nr:hypothetical protein D4764_08G0001270 [Takifugu flavidus]
MREERAARPDRRVDRRYNGKKPLQFPHFLSPNGPESLQSFYLNSSVRLSVCLVASQCWD